MAQPDPTIQGHPEIILRNAAQEPVMITVCAQCEQMRTILFLDKDRWFCMKCRNEGAVSPTVYPIARASRR